MKVEWIRCEERLPDQADLYWIQPSPILDDGETREVELAEWYADMEMWGVLGLSQLLHPHDDDGAPTHWAYAEVPDPPEEIADASTA